VVQVTRLSNVRAFRVEEEEDALRRRYATDSIYVLFFLLDSIIHVLIKL
jgi:hypothetical protein